jgi:hypothetical protein
VRLSTGTDTPGGERWFGERWFGERWFGERWFGERWFGEIEAVCAREGRSAGSFLKTIRTLTPCGCKHSFARYPGRGDACRARSSLMEAKIEWWDDRSGRYRGGRGGSGGMYAPFGY